MDEKQLKEQVSVSGQLSVDDIQTLVEAGVELLVCNRPDGESPDQTPFAEIRAAAESAGLEFVNIPFAGNELNASHAQEFSTLLKTGKRIHAYCRSGTRSGNLAVMASQL